MNRHHTVALNVSGLARSIGGRNIVDGVDLTVMPGELVTLVGPSGCGKTTLLNLIAGLDPADSGRVVLSGRDVTGLPPERRRVGFVFQDSALFGHLRVAENVAFGLRHLDRPARRQRVDEMLDLVRLTHLARRFPHQLSGGEQQRIALARALAPGPSVVLLDEPFASLDELLREELGQQVADILRTTSTAAILVTHDRREALRLGDRVAVMNAGRLLQCATPEEVYRSPVDRFVAAFIEVASFIPVDPSSGDSGVRLARPHHLRISEHGPDTVARVEFVGTGFRYWVTRSDGSTVVADRGPSPMLAPGSACTVTMIDEDLHRLD